MVVLEGKTHLTAQLHKSSLHIWCHSGERKPCLMITYLNCWLSFVVDSQLLPYKLEDIPVPVWNLGNLNLLMMGNC